MKLVKDPVHGYIKIKKDHTKNIIDSCEYQRLRNIRQTSYDSLYPGSCHNRFIHSLGVYYLGNKAFQAFRRNYEEQFNSTGISEVNWTCFSNTFELACLLHDVGHTPFSHTGESFLILDKEEDKFDIMQKVRDEEPLKVPILYNNLLRIMQSKLQPNTEKFNSFRDDFTETIVNSINYKQEKNVASPHEIMSVVIAIERYYEYLEKECVDIDLFARAILGLCYKKKTNRVLGIKNSLIQMLNSRNIDVDRLDYIIRDMQMSGFDSISIDIERLLDSVTLFCEPQSGNYSLGYKKNALSTIQNVVLAHDAERRWIQGHPVILHDSFLVEKCLQAVNQHYKVGNKNIFQQKAFSEEGVTLQGESGGNFKIRLMNDGDFIFLMKQLSEDKEVGTYITEYLSRDKRKQPIWKSEAEFNMILGEFSERDKSIFLNIFGRKEESDNPSIGSVLNPDRIENLKDERLKIQQYDNFNQEDKENSILRIEQQLFWLESLRTFCKECDIPFKIYNQKFSIFQSKVNDLKNNIMIWYPDFKKPVLFSDIIHTYQSSNDINKDNKDLFYLYIDKPKGYSFQKFVEFLKDTLSEYKRKFVGM